MADTEITIIGAGVVGLAVAARLAPESPGLIVIERQPRHGMETSSRNSQVIHAGIYYPQGSLKATLCVEGRDRLYDLCRRHALDHRRIGKLVTATCAEELPALEGILETARQNGVTVTQLSASEASEVEPHIRSAGALWSPDSGIVDVHAVMDHFLQRALAAEAVLYREATVVALERLSDGYRIVVSRAGETESFSSERVVNAAGLEADTIAGLAGIDVSAAGYRIHYAKGSYFSAATHLWPRVSHLIYPVPSHESLGLHVVLDTGGRLRFGPDVEYLPGRELDYRVDPARRAMFGNAARRLMPEVRDEDLEPDLSGIRPKLQGQGEPFRDFVIREERDRGLPGFYNLIGIDSPGLTAAPAIAEHVARLVAG